MIVCVCVAMCVCACVNVDVLLFGEGWQNEDFAYIICLITIWRKEKPLIVVCTFLSQEMI